MDGLGHRALGSDSVLLRQVEEEIPRRSVADGSLEEFRHCAAVDIFIRGKDDRLEEEVAFLEEVPEGVEVVREAEILHVELLNRIGTDGVEGGEEPAAAGSVLVGSGRKRGHLIFEDIVQHLVGIHLEREARDVAGVRDHILQGDCGGILDEAAAYGLKFGFAQALCEEGGAEAEGGKGKECSFHILRRLEHIIV